MVNKETVLCTEWSNSWERDMPATLIEYPDGSMDICIQTGDHFDRLFDKAKLELAKRNLMIEDENEESVWCTGAYFSVCQKP